MSMIERTRQSDWTDLNQAEREFPVSKRTLWLWITSGKLPAYRPFKKKVLIRRSELDKLLESTRDTSLDDVVNETMRELEAGK